MNRISTTTSRTSRLQAVSAAALVALTALTGAACRGGAAAGVFPSGRRYVAKPRIVQPARRGFFLTQIPTAAVTPGHRLR